MDPRTKLCIQRLLELQDRLAAIVDGVCNEVMMEYGARKRLVDSTKDLRESIARMTETISED